MAPRKNVMGMTGYQWLVILAAWLGWGFDVFDGLLFNYVAPNCVPTLLGIELGTAAAKEATTFWVGLMTALLLIGWGLGGILFGRVCDKIGRTKTLLVTMLMYAVGTALCAFAPNIWVLILFRFVASLGIGGEWAAGASMVAEVVPENKRVEAGAILYTSAPFGLFLAGGITWFIQAVAMAGSPETSWRIVFLTGLLPAFVAFWVRMFVKEPERFKQVSDSAGRLRDLFKGDALKMTVSGLSMAIVALVTWWSVNAFTSIVTAGLASAEGAKSAMGADGVRALAEQFKVVANNYFNVGGLIGTLLTVPIAKKLGRKWMFALYFAAASVSILGTFGLPLDPADRLPGYFLIGLSVFGVFGSFTYYLPELFPTRLRGTGAGFCYNVGRFLTAVGVFGVARVASMGKDAFETAMGVIWWVGFVPVLGLLLLPMVIETKGRALTD